MGLSLFDESKLAADIDNPKLGAKVIKKLKSDPIDTMGFDAKTRSFDNTTLFLRGGLGPWGLVNLFTLLA